MRGDIVSERGERVRGEIGSERGERESERRYRE